MTSSSPPVGIRSPPVRTRCCSTSRRSWWTTRRPPRPRTPLVRWSFGRGTLRLGRSPSGRGRPRTWWWPRTSTPDGTPLCTGGTWPPSASTAGSRASSFRPGPRPWLRSPWSRTSCSDSCSSSVSCSSSGSSSSCSYPIGVLKAKGPQRRVCRTGTVDRGRAGGTGSLGRWWPTRARGHSNAADRLALGRQVSLDSRLRVLHGCRLRRGSQPGDVAHDKRRCIRDLGTDPVAVCPRRSSQFARGMAEGEVGSTRVHHTVGRSSDLAGFRLRSVVGTQRIAVRHRSGAVVAVIIARDVPGSADQNSLSARIEICPVSNRLGFPNTCSSDRVTLPSSDGLSPRNSSPIKFTSSRTTVAGLATKSS